MPKLWHSQHARTLWQRSPLYVSGTQVPEHVLSGHSYHAADVHQWTSDISSLCLKNLKNVANGSAGFKYIGIDLLLSCKRFLRSFTIHNLFASSLNIISRRIYTPSYH